MRHARALVLLALLGLLPLADPRAAVGTIASATAADIDTAERVEPQRLFLGLLLTLLACRYSSQAEEGSDPAEYGNQRSPPRTGIG
jgi:hypothetical protein